MNRISKAVLAALVCTSLVLGGCGGEKKASGEKTVVYATTGYGREMGDAGLDPHENYSGWSTVRYGVGETLFRLSDAMTPEPWLAKHFTYVDDSTVDIELREGISFSSGRKMDGEAVKECLEALVAKNPRAAFDLKIDRIDAKENTVRIHTKESSPSLIFYLCDPYAAIVDMKADRKEGRVSGTGPYVADSVTDTEIHLHKNTSYWNGSPKVDHLIVKAVTDGDAMTAALQAGNIDATYGLPYASYPLFEDSSKFQISKVSTSRNFFAQVNMRSPVMQDIRVRKAIDMAIDREGFVNHLLAGHGEVAVGPFPKALPFGASHVHGVSYQADEARKLLEEAGWKDTDGNGYVDKDGKDLTIRWLTYPGRMELPALAELAQDNLKQIGIKVDVECSADHLKVLETGNYDVYASALVTAPTGDPEYFFHTCALDQSTKNRGFYHNDRLEALAKEMHQTFDTEKRNQLAIEMQQIILDDHAFYFISYLQMGILSRKGVTGLAAHPSDYYEITAELDVQ